MQIGNMRGTGVPVRECLPFRRVVDARGAQCSMWSCTLTTRNIPTDLWCYAPTTGTPSLPHCVPHPVLPTVHASHTPHPSIPNYSPFPNYLMYCPMFCFSGAPWA